MSADLSHDEAIKALCDCAATVTTLSYQEAIEGYFKLRGLPIPPDTRAPVENAEPAAFMYEHPKFGKRITDYRQEATDDDVVKGWTETLLYAAPIDLDARLRDARREDKRSTYERLADILRGSSLKPTKRYLSAAFLGYDYARTYARWEGYLEGVEEAAKVADCYESTASNERCDDPQGAAACDIAAAIRTLSERTEHDPE